MLRVAASVLVCAVLAHAPSARAEPDPASPDAPTAPLVPAPPPAVPADGEHAEHSAWDDWSLIPFLFFTPETSLGFGGAAVYSFDLGEGGPSLSTFAGGIILTANEQIIARIEPDLRFDRLLIHTFIRGQRYPTRFFPEGAHGGDHGEPYDEASVLGSVDARFRLSRAVSLGARCDFQWNELLSSRHGGELEQRETRGKRPWLGAGCGPVFSLDTRDDVRLPKRGLYAEARALAWTQLDGEEFAALQADLDLRGFVSLGAGHVLGAQLRWRATEGTVPFQLIPRLGGSNFLRGWFEGHLRDHNAGLLQVEWRFPLFWKIGGAVFGSAGEVFHRYEDFSLDGLRFGGGLGLRWLVNAKQNVSVRFDLAWGSGLAGYVDVLEAF